MNWLSAARRQKKNQIIQNGDFDFQSRRFFAFIQTYDEFSRNIVANSDLNCCICLKIKKYLMSLPHLPTSANFHQDIILHIQEVHQWRVRLMHNLIPVQSLNSFLLPNNQCKHIASRGVNIITVSVWIVFCKYCSHRIKSPYH